MYGYSRRVQGQSCGVFWRVGASVRFFWVLYFFGANRLVHSPLPSPRLPPLQWALLIVSAFPCQPDLERVPTRSRVPTFTVQSVPERVPPDSRLWRKLIPLCLRRRSLGPAPSWLIESALVVLASLTVVVPATLADLIAVTTLGVLLTTVSR